MNPLVVGYFVSSGISRRAWVHETPDTTERAARL